MSGEIGVLAGIVTISAFIPYIRDVVRGKTKPSRSTWIIWSILALILTASYYSVGARDTIWASIGFTLGQIAVALVSIRYGVGGWTFFDRICFIGAASGLAAWAVSGSALTGLLSAMAVDFIGALPTIKKLYLEPGSESQTSWLIFSAGNILNVAAIDKWSLEIALFPVYFLIVNGIIFALSLRRTKKQ